MTYRSRVGRVPIMCQACGRPCCTLSEAQLQRGAAFTLWRGQSSARLSEKITEAAAVICADCETAAARQESAHKG